MRRDNAVWETEPGSSPVQSTDTVTHLKRSVDMLNTPGGLISYCNQEKNRKRRLLLSDEQRLEVEKHFQTKLGALNDAGR
jgi:hypothetical protein